MRSDYPISAAKADGLLATAIDAVRARADRCGEVLDALPAAIYTTDPEGRVTYYNPACVEFSGRTPQLGADRWCVTWKLYTETGEHLPHDRCPMALAIRQKRAVRGARAVAERPDGTRVHFAPYPTPLLDEEGNLLGALNMLVDLGGAREAEDLRAQALKCRRLAAWITDPQTSETLTQLASEYDGKADGLLSLH
ncbi:MAG TPA: PAS domain-containing protein [Allosphingosinicella sp.]|nr:PAS domain-containing protein [Allosphingosinicella sp.]